MAGWEDLKISLHSQFGYIQNYVAGILIKKQAALSQKLEKYLCCITVFLIEDE